MITKVYTIGVYGFDEQRFFQSLLDARIDLLVDIRRRRALRGSQYAFANSQRLQDRLAALAIRYIHRLDLAPSTATRQMQDIHDRVRHTNKRDRQTLASDFIAAYQRECLDGFDVRHFLKTVSPHSSTLALFCVECEPTACHRSLVAARMAAFGMDVIHLVP